MRREGGMEERGDEWEGIEEEEGEGWQLIHVTTERICDGGKEEEEKKAEKRTSVH